jgi:hypothetical protein
MKDKSEIEQPGTPNEAELTSIDGKRLAAAASVRGKTSYSTAMMIVRLVIVSRSVFTNASIFVFKSGRLPSPWM